MPEKNLIIPSGNMSLEARYDPAWGGEVAIICHPHPLYGGDMDNNVVTALQTILSSSGWGTLRFNFRGVGGSGGQHRGSEGDVDDLMGVGRYLLEQEIRKVHFAGYSYGAWIGLKALKRGLALESMLLVSPPVDFLSFKDLEVPLIPCLITVGDQDEFCSLASLENWLSSQGMENSKLRVETVPHCDHFYWGREEALTRVVSDFLEKFRYESPTG